eukprot:m.608505 g.608505  ORF g.608505 m.608505 type:complete len:61 (+) comp22487_c1_seq2:32-214(+)
MFYSIDTRIPSHTSVVDADRDGTFVVSFRNSPNSVEVDALWAYFCRHINNYTYSGKQCKG